MKSNSGRYWYIALLLAATLLIAVLFWRPINGVAVTPQTDPKPNPTLANPLAAASSVASSTAQTVDPIYEIIRAEREQKLCQMAMLSHTQRWT
jgi:hypothetical protein